MKKKNKKKKQSEHGNVQNLCHLIIAFFTPFNFVTLCQFNALRNYRIRKKKILGVKGCFSVLRYIKRGKKSHHETQLNF